MDIMKSIQESAAGWRMGFASVFGGDSTPVNRTELGTAVVGPGYVTAQRRYAAVKAGTVARQIPGTRPPVGVRYIPASSYRDNGGADVDARYEPIDPGTPASVVQRIQRSIGESAEGWRMGFAHVTGKAKAGIEKSIAGWQMGLSHAGSKISETFGNFGSGIGSFKWLIYILLFVAVFVVVMASIGYSGLGGPTARIAEREHARAR